jgi:hypothetical protein
MSHPFIEEVKKNAGIPSDYALAKTLGVSKEVVSRWSTRKGKPDGINALRLAELGKIETKRAIELMESGFASVSLLAVTSVAGISLIINKIDGIFSSIHCILC